MMSNPLISVIVPAYNAENWIKECCQSVLAQTYTHWELIIIDDGSIDNTYKIASQFSNTNAGIKVIHTKNGGVSKARNIGIKEAKGEYIVFLDADDLLIYDALEKMKMETQVQPCDIVIGWKTNMDQNGNELGCPYQKEEAYWTKEQALEMSLRDHPATYAVWGKLYKRTLIENVHFIEGRQIHEDSFFLFQCFCKMPNVKLTKEIFVKYRISPDSASRSEFSDKFFDILYFGEEKRKIIQSNFQNLHSLAENTFLKANMAMLRVLCKSPSKYYNDKEKECIKNIISNKRYFWAATADNKKWFGIITHHLYYPYKMLLKFKIKLSCSRRKQQ